MEKRKVILVTDGDKVARKAVEIAAANIGGRCISASAGNPTRLTGEEIVNLVKKAHNDPVVVMVDDRGVKGVGKGEEAMSFILKDESLDVLGVVAVSSNGEDCNGLKVSCSITQDGRIVDKAVDKYGVETHADVICGDTLSILKGKKDLTIVGIGDPGKMDFMDEISKGAPITTMALKEVLKRSS
ncbi:MAG: stage V sporulation protein AE [Clostridia bacterium]|nr:stage V sporulation protein AE [Clostridia bacterium]